VTTVLVGPAPDGRPAELWPVVEDSATDGAFVAVKDIYSIGMIANV
jgi:hypothetical protein